jgi:light-regulated signal transduction histidine kinase (bacteriophytochrome)
LLSVSRDITAQKKAEEEIMSLNSLLEEKVKSRTEELLEKNIELEKINKQLAVFHYIACHDLQEPLRKIQLFSGRIRDVQIDDETVNFYLKRILAASERMRSLLDSLNKYSALNDFKSSFESCDLNDIVQDVTDYLQDTLLLKQAKIEKNQLPVIFGSKVLLNQLFINILENGLKYSRTDNVPFISISTYDISSDQLAFPIKKDITELHVIEIKDNGIGFDNIYRHQIFDPYKRLHNDNSTSTGTGLAICKTIAENHDGWIDATSIPDVGSTFKIYFPKTFSTIA